MANLNELPPAILEDQYVTADKAIAFGMGGMIVRTPSDPGYCYKIPGTPDAEQALDELAKETQIHDVLEELDIPTIPTYEMKVVTTTHEGQQITLPCYV